MSNQKFQTPSSPPPPAYGSDHVSTPSPAHVAPSNNGSDYYNASPQPQYQNQLQSYPQNGPPQQYQHQNQNNGYPPQEMQGGYPPQGQFNNGYNGGYNGGYGQPNGYYAPGPQYGGYGGQQGMQYGPGPGMQGGYYQQDRGRGMGAGEGFMAACLGALACCCCLDILF